MQVSVCISEKIDLRLRDLAHERRTSRSAEARAVLESWEEAERVMTPEVEKRLAQIQSERDLTRIGAVNAALAEWAKTPRTKSAKKRRAA